MQAGRVGFLRNFLCDPRGVGAVAPATASLARNVASAAHELWRQHSRGVQVIELGAGTGALSQSLSRMQPILVERNDEWAHLLRLRFPALEVRNECAVETLRSLRSPVGLVSSIPLLNNPQAGELKSLIRQAYADGLLRYCVLYTYGWRDPLAGSGFREHRRARFVPGSLPPAHVWAYQ
jgi:phospholipid N-methyltransferase